ncbi:hypothetical protein J7J13_04235 [bacterium]|nr:hypothetical protein [bacterium]
MRFSKKKILIILVAIVLLGTFLRFYKLGEVSFSADEFLGVNVAYGYLQTGEWKRWDFNLGKLADDKPYFKTVFDFDIWDGGEKSYTRAWAYNWQIVQALKFLPADEESTFRAISALWGIITILIIYWTAAAFTGNKIIGLISAFLFAISIDGITFDRKARMYAMFLPVFLLFSHFVYQLFESRKYLGSELVKKIKLKAGFNIVYVIPAITLGLLSAHLHLLAVNIIPALLVYFLVLAFMEAKNRKVFLNHYAVYVLTAAAFSAALFIFCPNILSLLKSFLTPNDHFSYIGKVLSDYASGILALALIILGTAYLWNRERKKCVFVSSLFWTTLLMAIFFWNRNAGEQYIFFIKPFQIILLSSGIYFTAKFIGKNFRQYGRKFYWVSLAVLILLLPDYVYFFQENNAYHQNSNSEHPNYKKVFGYFLKNKKEGDILITRNFRNYYFAGANAKVFSIGGERAGLEEKKLTLKRLKKIMRENSRGWIIFSDNDKSFISKDAREYIIKKTERVSNSKVRGPVSVYYWRDKRE